MMINKLIDTPFAMATVNPKNLSTKHSWGVASARHISGLTVKEGETPYLFDAPLGPNIIRWNVEKCHRMFEFQVLWLFL